MFSDIAGVRTALHDRLLPLVPAGWTIEPALKQPPAEYFKPLITFEFTRLDPAADGQPLGPGTAAAGIDLVLGTPKTTEGPAEDDVDDLVHTLVQAIDSQSDIYWSGAEKQRLDSGQWVWRIHTTALTSKE